MHREKTPAARENSRDISRGSKGRGRRRGIGMFGQRMLATTLALLLVTGMLPAMAFMGVFADAPHSAGGGGLFQL
jgi:hypothetical protein